MKTKVNTIIKDNSIQINDNSIQAKQNLDKNKILNIMSNITDLNNTTSSSRIEKKIISWKKEYVDNLKEFKINNKTARWKQISDLMTKKFPDEKFDENICSNKYYQLLKEAKKNGNVEGFTEIKSRKRTQKKRINLDKSGAKNVLYPDYTFTKNMCTTHLDTNKNKLINNIIKFEILNQKKRIWKI